jgi:hypothetical protein
MDASVVAELVGHGHRSTAGRFYNNITTMVMKIELEKFIVAYTLKKETGLEDNNEDVPVKSGVIGLEYLENKE